MQIRGNSSALLCFNSKLNLLKFLQQSKQCSDATACSSGMELAK